jgi:hypothetical protein
LAYHPVSALRTETYCVTHMDQMSLSYHLHHAWIMKHRNNLFNDLIDHFLLSNSSLGRIE